MHGLLMSDLYVLLRNKALRVLFGISVFMSLFSFFIWNRAYDAIYVVVALQGDADALAMYLLFPAVAIVTSSIFYYGTAKNDIAYGVPRSWLYFSKLLLALLVCLLLVVAYYLPAFIAAVLFNGLGKAEVAWHNIIIGIGANFLVYTAFVSLGIFLVFLLKSTSLAAVAFYVFVVIMAFFVPLVTVTDANVHILRAVDLFNGIRMTTRLGALPTEFIVNIFVGVFLYNVLFISIGVYSFGRSEIK